MPNISTVIKVIESPRISLNKLGEYLNASPSRRRSIIREQKFPKTFIVARYNEAEGAIVDYIVSRNEDTNVLISEIERLLSSDFDTEWKQQTAELCADAIENFFNYFDTTQYIHLLPEKGDITPPPLHISGVNISVRPEVIFKKDEKVVGGLKLCFAKIKPLGENAGNIVATVLYRYLVDFYKAESSVNPANCFVLDIFAGASYCAPKSFKKTMGDVLAACDEIAGRWPSINL